MQSTGLLASKSYRGESEEDRLIFEGDIVSFFYPGNGLSSLLKGVVYQCDGCFWIDCTETHGDEAMYQLGLIARSDYVVIIGNKYEHPELLGGESQ